ncbi:MAG: DUF1902 domain-containing protein [Roseibium sp.]|uniref:DUF1902 domain-containing protein n=1 Tax=Alphaproteobacteria TaxID=28211 RepID=UPI00326504CB
MNFYVKARWDDDAKVFYSDSDIIGLHIEANTIEEFEDIAMEVAPMLVLENHITKNDLAQKSWSDMIPSIFFKSPNVNAPA